MNYREIEVNDLSSDRLFKNYIRYSRMLSEEIYRKILIYNWNLHHRLSSHFPRLPCAPCSIKQERPLFDQWDNYYGKSSAAVIFFRHLQFYFHETLLNGRPRRVILHRSQDVHGFHHHAPSILFDQLLLLIFDTSLKNRSKWKWNETRVAINLHV